MDGLDQRGLHGGGVGGSQAQGLTGGLDRGIRHAEDVMHGVVHNAQETEQHQHGEQHRQTAGHGIEAVLLLQLHHFFLLFLGIVFVLLLDLVHQRLEHRHLGGGFLLVDGQREQQQLQNQGGNDHRYRVVADEVVQYLHQRANQDGQEVENLHSLSILPRLRPEACILT